MKEELKDFWAYKEVSKNYKVKADKTKVTILWKDGTVYTEYEIKEIDGSYLVYNQGELINDEMDFTETLLECQRGCIYHFHTRY